LEFIWNLALGAWRLKNMEQKFKQAKQLIDESSRILLTMHERMDGDDGGSVLAVMHYLREEGKEVVCAIKQGVPESLQFLPGSEKIKDEITHSDFDLLITFGCSDLNRTGLSKILNLKSKILNIDHHPDNKLFGDVNIVDEEKSSVAELLYDFFIYSGWGITKDIATCLLTGIITDTGSFKHSNTKAETLKISSELMRKGANISKIISHTYSNKNPKILKAWGKAMENSYYDEKNKIIYSVITEEDMDELRELPKAAFDGFVETLNTAPETKFAMFIRQEGNIIKGSLRSEEYKQIDVSKIARQFGGGGHKLAAGFSVAGKLLKDERGNWKII